MPTSKEVQKFTQDIDDAFQAIDRMHWGSHGDRVVAMALLNPELEIVDTPMQVAEELKQVVTVPAQLWTLFKECGGVSKELEPFEDEYDQHETLRKVWSRITQVAKKNTP